MRGFVFKENVEKVVILSFKGFTGLPPFQTWNNCINELIVIYNLVCRKDSICPGKKICESGKCMTPFKGT